MPPEITFSPAQPAVITGLSLRWVQKAIDGQRIPARQTREGKVIRRHLSHEALVCLHLESTGLSIFPPAIRKRIIADILRRPEDTQSSIHNPSALTVVISCPAWCEACSAA